jgi:hypothetical protein
MGRNDLFKTAAWGPVFKYREREGGDEESGRTPGLFRLREKGQGRALRGCASLRPRLRRGAFGPLQSLARASPPPLRGAAFHRRYRISKKLNLI